MKYHYTITRYKCPKCKHTLKTESPFSLFLLLFPFVLLSLPSILGISIFKKLCDITKIPKIEIPYTICPKCGLKIKDDSKHWWCDYGLEEKKTWASRYLIITCYIISGFMPICLLFQFLWDSKFQSDKNWALCFLILAILGILFVGLFVYSWKTNLKNKLIKITTEDYALIQKNIHEYEKSTKQKYEEKVDIFLKDTGRMINNVKLKEKNETQEKQVSEIQQTQNKTFNYCHNCGEKLIENANFCNNCGEKIKR